MRRKKRKSSRESAGGDFEIYHSPDVPIVDSNVIELEVDYDGVTICHNALELVYKNDLKETLHYGNTCLYSFGEPDDFTYDHIRVQMNPENPLTDKVSFGIIKIEDDKTRAVAQFLIKEMYPNTYQYFPDPVTIEIIVKLQANQTIKAIEELLDEVS